MAAVARPSPALHCASATCATASKPSLGPRWQSSEPPQAPPSAAGELPAKPHREVTPAPSAKAEPAAAVAPAAAAPASTAPAPPAPPAQPPPQPADVVSPRTAPSEIDTRDLVLAESVGTGGTAEVFKGTYRSHTVAIKQLFRHRKMDDKEKISFEREVSVLAAITHPNLVKFFGVAFKEKPFRIVTEFCHGGTCFDLIHNSGIQLSWTQKVKISIDTACGMYYLHNFKPQIIHRDLKSLNLLLEKHVKSARHIPTVKVADFGLSRMKAPGVAWGKMTAQVGTLHWMAPEVFSGSDYDEKCDVYSYAMVMYEAVCQMVPFEDMDPGLIGSTTTKGVRPNLLHAPKGFPGKFRDLMCACWAQNSSQRPSFLSALRSIIEIDKEFTDGAATAAAPAAAAAAATVGEEARIVAQEGGEA